MNLPIISVRHGNQIARAFIYVTLISSNLIVGEAEGGIVREQRRLEVIARLLEQVLIQRGVCLVINEDKSYLRRHLRV